MASHGIAKTEYGTYKAWFRFDDGAQHAKTFKTSPRPASTATRCSATSPRAGGPAHGEGR